LLVTSSAWRLGTRVVIEGMRSARAKHLNGLTGIVSKHPRNGHPMFIMKKSCPNIPQLVLCIVFDDPEAARERSALLEPRFIKPFDVAAKEMIRQLTQEDIIRQLTETIACLPQEARKQTSDTHDFHDCMSDNGSPSNGRLHVSRSVFMGHF